MLLSLLWFRGKHYRRCTRVRVAIADELFLLVNSSQVVFWSASTYKAETLISRLRWTILLAYGSTVVLYRVVSCCIVSIPASMCLVDLYPFSVVSAIWSIQSVVRPRIERSEKHVQETVSISTLLCRAGASPSAHLHACMIDEWRGGLPSRNKYARTVA